MVSGVRRLTVCLVCCVVGLAVSPVIALGEGSPSGGASSAEGSGALSSLEGSLVTPGSPTQGEQAQAAEGAKLANPEAVAEREASTTKFEGLNTEQADKADAEAFPELLNHPLGGPPALPAGQHITSYLADNAARVSLPEGKHGLIEATEPMAVEGWSGQRTPIDLGLSEVGNAFEPATPAVGVSIPKRLSAGVQLPALDLSLTPIDSSGSSLGGSEGAVDGSSVLYANTQTDTDTLVKPTTGGFEADTLLRSVESPEQLYFRVGLPQGASLAQAQGASGPVNVVVEGHVMATIAPPGATDSAGTSVPVSMTVKGNVLTLTVAAHGGEYQYPIMVDPTVIDSGVFLPGNWAFTTNDPSRIKIANNSYLGVEGSSEVPLGDWSLLEYPTQGKSRIYEAQVYTDTENSKGNRNSLAIESPAKSIESNGGSLHEPPTEDFAKTVLCVAGGCAVPTVTPESQSNVLNYETLVQGKGGFEVYLLNASEYIVQEAGPTFGGFDTIGETTSTGLLNGLYGHKWENTSSGRWGVQASATDPGLGIKHAIWSSPNASKWGGTTEVGECKGQQCDEAVSPTYSLKGLFTESEPLPDGEDTIDLKVEDPVGLTATGVSAKIKVDNTPPHNITLTGLPSTHEIGDGEHLALTASATDGSGPESSGVASIVLAIDGAQVGSPSGGCSPGTCTAKGEWTISAENYSAGKHTITVTATDNVGNVAKEEFELTIHHAAPMGVGPGVVNPVTGELSLGATDVSANGADGGLVVGRSYRSRHLGSLAEGPLGPQWTLNLGASESLYRTPSGAMVLTSTSGEQSVFASNGGGKYTSPPGDGGLVLSEKIVSGKTDFLLTENGAVTTFTVPTGGTGLVWEPSVSEGAGGTNAIGFVYRTEGGVTEPTEELAPVPAGVSCSPTLTKGCRALTFVYAEKTKESIGESQTEWGEYKGRLKEVLFTAYDPSSKEMKTKAVAQYSYDKQGRLRAEWNPLISPALKTQYGYDGEGHLTALAPAGQQPWLIEQGTSANDAAPGRVLAVARPAATTEAVLKTELEAPAPVDSVVPTLSSTTPTVGVKISVSGNGTWTNSPLAYSYQWEDCNTAGKECTAIPGAVNQAYFPVPGDEGHTLAAKVVALNANGSVTASSIATSKVAAGTPNTPLPEPPSVGTLSVLTIDYQVPLSGTEVGLPKMSATEVAKWGQIDVPEHATAVFPPDKVMGWPAKEYTRASISYLDGRDRTVNFSSSTGGISTTEYNLDNDVIRTLSPDNRATALAAGEEKSKELSKELDSESTYEEKGTEPGTELLSSLGPKHAVQLSSGTKVEARAHTLYSYNEGAPTEGGPYRLPTKITQGAQYSGKEEDVRTTKTAYSGQENLGWRLRKPTSVTTDPAGLNLTRSTFYEPKTGNVTETRLPAAGAPKEEQEYSLKLQFGKKGTGSGEFTEPQGIAVTASGDEYVLDTGNNRVEEFNTKGELVRTFGTGLLKEPHGISLDSQGNVWVANTGDNSIDEFSSTGVYKETYIESEPTAPLAIAVNSEGKLFVIGTGSDHVSEYINVEGEYFFARSFGEKGSGEAQMLEPQGVATGSEGDIYISDTGNDRIDEYSVKTGEVVKHIRNFGKEGTLNGQLKGPHQISIDSAGHVWVADTGNNRIQEFGSTGTFLSTFGKEGSTEGKLKGPKGVAVDAEGNPWVADTANSNVQEWKLNSKVNAHETQTIYYSAGANSTYPGCGEHPEWANLPCQTQPAKQPGTTGLPNLPVTTVTYNIWDKPETTTETVEKGTEKTVRTKTATYQPSGRLEKSAVSSTVGTALPTITYKYSATLGALEEQSNEGKTKPIVSHYNTLGQLTSYTDADEGTTTYEYDEDGRIKKANDEKGTETYTYSKTTGLLTELLNEYGTTKLAFTGSYDPQGNLLSEGYPNGMNANYTYNQTGETTGLEYKKTTHCTTGCTWYQENVVPSVHGQDLAQTNTVEGEASTDNYTYDTASRLTQVQETPAGKGCTTRVYAYDADTNRASLTTRAPGSEGKCATEGGTEEKHTYDEADRLTDTATSYDTFGDITTLPAADTGGKEASENLTSTYYTDSQLAGQTQKEQTIGYKLDPTGRTLETVSTGKPVVSDVINHYAGPGSSPAWSENTTTNEWTRNISGIGGFAAVQVNGGTPVLKLSDLHGDIIATAALSETETKLLSNTTMTEYGVPTTTKPEKYGWLGADQLTTELPSGTIDMGARSYVPQIGRFLQTDPIPGGSANAYSYTFGDPVNTSDPSGEYTASVQGFAIESAEQRSAEYLEYLAMKAAEEAAARAQAERAAQEATAALFTREAEIAGSLKAAEASWCGGEYGPCAEEGGSGGGCSGDNACAAGYSDEWVCTEAGTVIAAGITFVGGANPVSTLAGILAGGSFTAGCELGRSSNATYVSGLAHPSSCFNEWTLSKRTHQYDHRREFCYT